MISLPFTSYDFTRLMIFPIGKKYERYSLYDHTVPEAATLSRCGFRMCLSFPGKPVADCGAGEWKPAVMTRAGSRALDTFGPLKTNAGV
jgi:hypothetical protein